MDPINPPQHSCLVLWKTPIPELPGMDPKLLPIEVTQFKHAMLGQERVCMVPPLFASNQASKPLLVPDQGTPQCQVPPLLKVPPHHQAILQVRENKPIVEQKKAPAIQDSARPTKYPQ